MPVEIPFINEGLSLCQITNALEQNAQIAGKNLTLKGEGRVVLPRLKNFLERRQKRVYEKLN